MWVRKQPPGELSTALWSCYSAGWVRVPRPRLSPQSTSVDPAAPGINFTKRYELLRAFILSLSNCIHTSEKKSIVTPKDDSENLVPCSRTSCRPSIYRYIDREYTEPQLLLLKRVSTSCISDGGDSGVAGCGMERALTRDVSGRRGMWLPNNMLGATSPGGRSGSPRALRRIPTVRMLAAVLRGPFQHVRPAVWASCKSIIIHRHF